MPHGKNDKGDGSRRPVYKGASQVSKVIEDAQTKSSVRKELMSIICEALKHGDTARQMMEWMEQRYPRYGRSCTREDCWRLIRRAARNGWLRYDPPPEQSLQQQLEERYEWQSGRLSVVHSAVLNQVAREAAETLLELVRECREEQGLDTIRIGFAGGRSLRKVAQHLSQLLSVGSKRNPKEIVFHAIVSAFGAGEYMADPNSFITYFVQEPHDVRISFANMPAPGIVKSSRRNELKTFEGTKDAFEAAQDLNIIVTSGGRLDDEHGMLSAYLDRCGSTVQKAGMREQLRANRVVGDLMWQPITVDGPFSMQSNGFEYCPNALVDLDELPGFIDRGVRVLLVLGACGACGQPKGALLDAILGSPVPLVTDLVSDSPNVYELLELARGGEELSCASKPR